MHVCNMFVGGNARYFLEIGDIAGFHISSSRGTSFRCEEPTWLVKGILNALPGTFTTIKRGHTTQCTPQDTDRTYKCADGIHEAVAICPPQFPLVSVFFMFFDIVVAVVSTLERSYVRYEVQGTIEQLGPI